MTRFFVVVALLAAVTWAHARVSTDAALPQVSDLVQGSYRLLPQALSNAPPQAAPPAIMVASAETPRSWQPSDNDAQLAKVLLLLVGGVFALWFYAVWVVSGIEPAVPSKLPVVAPRHTNEGVPRAAATPFPAPEAWAHRAGRIRNPVGAFIFDVQASSNAKAMAADKERVRAVREVAKEYTGMFKDLLEGQEAATAYSVRRDMAAEFHDHGRLQQQDAFEEDGHRRCLGHKRREKEMTEAETRRIGAAHEQEALERFKEAKFQTGFARFEVKTKEHLVGAASAEAAIAEVKLPAKMTNGGNESAEVAKLYALLQEKVVAIEEGERLGRDTQLLREQVELYRKLLNLT